MKTIKVDALVVGGGIAGMQAALDLADQDLQVAIVEKNPSIGGKMIELSKVFPTLDCCSCITTPKMSAVAHHENIKMFTYCEVQSVEENGNGYTGTILQKPRYVDESTCTACRDCEYVCPVTMPNDFDSGLGGVRAIRVPFSTAVPQTAVLDPDYCLWCGKCETVCSHNSIDFSQQPEKFTIKTKTIVLATGFEITPKDEKKEYGAGKLHNVISGLTMERLLAPTGPYGHILRPGDGKEPESIAYVQCAGSRDATLNREYCSRVCCMYAIKQAMLISGSLPLADITIYYMDIRAFGKGYEQFFVNARAMGVEFVKAKVASITEDEDMNPVLRVEMIDDEGQVVERTHDLVVLSVGLQSAYDADKVFGVPADEDGFARIPFMNGSPCSTGRPGIFVTGTAAGPMDIVDSVVMAGAVAAEATAYIHEMEAAPEAAPALGD